MDIGQLLDCQIKDFLDAQGTTQRSLKQLAFKFQDFTKKTYEKETEVYRVIALLLRKSTINNIHHALHNIERNRSELTINIIFVRKDMQYLQSQ
jgi:predicted transcriptional regulator